MHSTFTLAFGGKLSRAFFIIFELTFYFDAAFGFSCLFMSTLLISFSWNWSWKVAGRIQVHKYTACEASTSICTQRVLPPDSVGNAGNLVRYADYFCWINHVDPRRVKFMDEAHIDSSELQRQHGLGDTTERYFLRILGVYLIIRLDSITSFCIKERGRLQFCPTPKSGKNAALYGGDSVHCGV
jgi:hypothetical protein